MLNGTAQGALLLLAALGLSLTFGQMGVINMAHGEFLMVGAFAAYVVQQVDLDTSDLSIPVALPVAFVVAGLLGLLLEVSVIQWMYRQAPRHPAGHGRCQPDPAAGGTEIFPPRASRWRSPAGSTGS